MCGIVGYIGGSQAADILLEGLSRLEYRGYDSAGIAVINGKVSIRRREGKLVNLRNLLRKEPLHGHTGIGHTRWATHGAPNETNAHPHNFGKITLVHNGIIENYAALRERLSSEGHTFQSETDTEVVAHLIHRAYEESGDPLIATRDALKDVEGSYALAILCDDVPGSIVTACKQSPLVLGIGENENLLASDIPALLPFTRDVIFLEDETFAVITANSVKIMDKRLKEVPKKVTTIAWDPIQAEKGGFKHFMLKEIFEQPRAVSQTLAGRITPRATNLHELDGLYKIAKPKRLRQIEIVACGTSWHAAHIGKFWLEKYARIPVIVDYASEHRYRAPVHVDNAMMIAISQSGETADTVAAASTARNAGYPLLSICNVLESRLARASDAVLYTHAGPEIGVASTKAFVTQLCALILVAADLGQRRDTITKTEHTLLHRGLAKIPRLIESLLVQEPKIAKIAKAVQSHEDFLYLGRGTAYPLALEGALKLKEISYIHAEGYPAGEMKHGPIALIDKNLPVVCLMLKGEYQDKMMANVQEVRAREGKIIGIVTEGDDAAMELCDWTISVPTVHDELDILLASLPLQLLAYYIAIERGTDVDQPRNLAKSVTVE